MNSPRTTHLSQHLMTSRPRFLGDGTGAVRLAGGFLALIRALGRHHWQEIIGRAQKSRLKYLPSVFRLFSNSSKLALADYQNRF